MPKSTQIIIASAGPAQRLINIIIKKYLILQPSLNRSSDKASASHPAGPGSIPGWSNFFIRVRTTKLEQVKVAFL